ncbi:hypothetical protein V8C35DRAFT_298944 [Trichoderma chlorosporum]
MVSPSRAPASPPLRPQWPPRCLVLDAYCRLAPVLANIPAVPGLKSHRLCLSRAVRVLGPSKVPALDDDRSKQDRGGFVN